MDAPGLDELLQGDPLGTGGADLWLPEGVDFTTGGSDALDALLVSLTDPFDAPGLPFIPDGEQSSAAATFSMQHASPVSRTFQESAPPITGRMGWGHPALLDVPEAPHLGQQGQQLPLAQSQLPVGDQQRSATQDGKGDGAKVLPDSPSRSGTSAASAWGSNPVQATRQPQVEQVQASPCTSSPQPSTSSDSAAPGSPPGHPPTGHSVERRSSDGSPSGSDCEDSGRSSSGTHATGPSPTPPDSGHSASQVRFLTASPLTSDL